MTVTVSGAAATEVATFTATAFSGTTTIAYATGSGGPTNTLSLTPAVATAATGSITIGATPTAGDNVVVGSITYTYRSGTLTTPTGNNCNVEISNTSTSRTNLRSAILTGGSGSGSTYICATGVNANTAVTVGTITGSNIPLTATAVGAAGNSTTLTGSFSNSGSNFVTAFSGGVTGTDGCTSSTTGTFIATASAAAQQATDFYNAIVSCHSSYPQIGFQVLTAPSSTTATITADAPGTAVSVTANNPTAGLTWAHSGTLEAGTDGTLTACSTFRNSGNATTLAGYINTALTGCSGFTSSASTNTVTVATTAVGSGATLAFGGTDTKVSWGSNTGGFNGTTSGTSSPPTFAYWSGSTYVSASQLATNIATALNANTTVSAVLSAAPNSPSGGNLTITAKVAGTGGNSYSATPNGSFTAFTGGTLSGGNGAAVQPNAYPAKFSFSTTTATCSDYAVYPVGTAAGRARQTLSPTITFTRPDVPAPRRFFGHITQARDTQSRHLQFFP